MLPLSQEVRPPHVHRVHSVFIVSGVLLVINVHINVPVIRRLLIEVALSFFPELSVGVEVEPRPSLLPDQLYLVLEGPLLGAGLLLEVRVRGVVAGVLHLEAVVPPGLHVVVERLVPLPLLARVVVPALLGLADLADAGTRAVLLAKNLTVNEDPLAATTAAATTVPGEEVVVQRHGAELPVPGLRELQLELADQPGGQPALLDGSQEELGAGAHIAAGHQVGGPQLS